MKCPEMLKTDIGELLEKPAFWWISTQALIGIFFICSYVIRWNQAHNQIHKIKQVQENQSEEIEKIEKRMTEVGTIKERLDRLADGQDGLRKLIIKSFRDQGSSSKRGGFYRHEKDRFLVHSTIFPVVSSGLLFDDWKGRGQVREHRPAGSQD